jgi:UDP-N-acetylglucosamine:LPS N-acetylglucosamine transferase
MSVRPAVAAGVEAAVVSREVNARPETARVELMLVCSTGGHLLQLVGLRDAWQGHTRVWITHDHSDTRSLLDRETVVVAHYPTQRNLPNLARNLVLAWRVVRDLRPSVVLTTGAGVAVPFAWIGRLFGARVVYVESLTRVRTPSLSFRLIAPVASRAYAQWPELAARFRMRYAGSLVPR